MTSNGRERPGVPLHAERGDDCPAALSDAATRRLSNQIERAVRGTYGARTGLRTLVASIAQQMLAAGHSRESIAQTFERCVLDHTSRTEHAQLVEHSASGRTEAESRTLIELARECAIEVSHMSVAPGAPGSRHAPVRAGRS